MKFHIKTTRIFLPLSFIFKILAHPAAHASLFLRINIAFLLYIIILAHPAAHASLFLRIN